MDCALLDYFTIYITQRNELITEFTRHLSMTTISVLLAIIIGVPLGILITKSKKISSPIIAIANVMQSIPCMALLGLGIPILGIGERLAIFMTLVYAFLPILKNTFTGISSISPSHREVAKGIGLSKMQRLVKIEIPIAIPYIMSGIRIAMVSAVGTMTIAAFAGAKGLGWFIVLGMNSRNYPMIVMGAVCASVMALGLDYILAIIEKALTSEGLYPAEQIKNLNKNTKQKRKNIAALLIFIMVVFSVYPFAKNKIGSNSKQKQIVVGTSNFTEVIILGHIYEGLIEANTDYDVVQKPGLAGASVCFDALKSGEIDMFVEYTGTALLNWLNQPMNTDRNQVHDIISTQLKDNYNIITSQPIGFNNTYVMSVTPQTAQKYQLEKLSDLIQKANQLKLGCTIEFIQRDDCLPLMENKYNINFKESIGLDSNLRYDALARGEVEIIDAFATDAMLSKMTLIKLSDDLGFFPPYDAVNFVRAEILETHPELRNVLSMLDGKITEEKMAYMNAAVDIDGLDAKEVADNFLIENGLK